MWIQYSILFTSKVKYVYFQVKMAMLKKHRHQFEGIKKQVGESGSGTNLSKLPIIRSLADIGRTHSSSKSKKF